MTSRVRRATADGGLTAGQAARPGVRPIAPAPRPAGRHVVLDALRAQLDGAEWAPLRLATGRRERPASPRLPHALALHLAHAARAVAVGGASVADAEVCPDLPRLEALLAADEALVAGAVDALERAGVVVATPGAPGAPRALRIAPSVLGPEPRCASLDWRELAAATAGSPSAWVAVHALAERLDPYDWTPVPRGALERALGCGVSGVRAALERLVSAGVVERREQRGGVSIYRFTDLAWGRGRGGGHATAVVSPPSAAAQRPAPGVSAAATPAATSALAPRGTAALPDAGVRLVLGGVELELPAGCRAQVVIGPDGRPTITLAGPAAGS